MPFSAWRRTGVKTRGKGDIHEIQRRQHGRLFILWILESDNHYHSTDWRTDVPGQVLGVDYYPMKRSGISYVDYSGFNLVTGCTPVSFGCQNCFARRMLAKFNPGRDPDQVLTNNAIILKLRREKFAIVGNKREPNTSRPLVFVNDMGDLFHRDADPASVRLFFDVMAFRSDADFVVLTKRPERIGEVLCDGRILKYIPESQYPNVALGVSVESQAVAQPRIETLLRFWHGRNLVSAEPLLYPITLKSWLKRLDWVLVGGESGPNHRPFQKEWAETLWWECGAAGVAFFAKQDSGYQPGTPLLIDGHIIHQWPMWK